MSTAQLLAEVDALTSAYRKHEHAQVERNREEEANRTMEGRRAREEHLKLIGDSDA